MPLFCRVWGLTIPLSRVYNIHTAEGDKDGIRYSHFRIPSPRLVRSGRNGQNAMSCLAIDHVVKLELLQKLDDQDVVNIMYFEQAIAWAEGDAEILAGDVWEWWRTEQSDVLSNEISLRQIRVTDMTSLTGFVLDYVSPLGVATGGVVSEALPNNVACVVSFRTGLRGRRNRGRNYLAGIPEGSIASNSWGNSLVTALVTNYQTLATTLAANATPKYHVVFSCVPSGSPTPDVGSGRAVQEYIVNPIAATQRRRLPGRGR